MVMDGDTNAPKKKRRPPEQPRILAKTPEELARSIERLARWVLRPGTSPGQVKQVRACASLLRLRIEMERLAFDRERWEREMQIEDRLTAIEAALAQEAER